MIVFYFFTYVSFCLQETFELAGKCKLNVTAGKQYSFYLV